MYFLKESAELRSSRSSSSGRVSERCGSRAAEAKDGGRPLGSTGGLRVGTTTGTGGWITVDIVGGKIWTEGSFGGPSFGFRSIPVLKENKEKN